MKLITLFLVLLIGCILTNSSLSFQYASLGLELWFTKMIPTLLPFMILSGILIRMNLTGKITSIFYPVLSPLFRVSRNVGYCMLMGFLCGFPMGAKVTAESYERQLITKQEAEYLLAFCNNIGPVYFCSFVLPLLKRRLTFPYLLIMYGIPLLYGLLLRYTRFRSMETPSCRERSLHPVYKKSLRHAGKEPHSLHICEISTVAEGDRKQNPAPAEQLLAAVNDAVFASVQSMLMLGGYMILFNLLNLLPMVLFGERTASLFAPVIEITGGLMQLQDSLPLYSLLVLSFGGLCCIAQTYGCISRTDLSVCDYLRHKVLLTLLTAGFYLGWYLLFPDSFLG